VNHVHVGFKICLFLEEPIFAITMNATMQHSIFSFKNNTFKRNCAKVRTRSGCTLDTPDIIKQQRG
jgi:hypothetical protein